MVAKSFHTSKSWFWLCLYRSTRCFCEFTYIAILISGVYLIRLISTFSVMVVTTDVLYIIFVLEFFIEVRCHRVSSSWATSSVYCWSKNEKCTSSLTGYITMRYAPHILRSLNLNCPRSEHTTTNFCSRRYIYEHNGYTWSQFNFSGMDWRMSGDYW